MTGRQLVRAVVMMGMAASTQQCTPRKVETAGTTASSDSAASTSPTGTVTTAFVSEGCAVLVDLGEGNDPRYLWPLSLDPQFAKDGLRISFTYRLSRAPSTTCFKGPPAVLENVAVVK